MALTIKVATATNRERVFNTLTQAFGADPVVRWIFAESEQYLKWFPGFADAVAGKAFDHGSADWIEDGCGAALWLPPGIRPDDTALFAMLQEIVRQRQRDELFALFEQMERNHPAEPHWYLPMIGVDPAKQGRGYGSTLLRYGLGRCDREGIMSYLESSSRQNLPLYERHGFEPRGTIQVGSSPPLFPMARNPQLPMGTR